MKYFVFFIYLSLVLIFTCCTDNEVIDNELNFNFPLFIENNTWGLSYFSEDKIDKTSTYDAYIFEFDEDGVLKITNKESVYIGKWKISKYFFYHLDFDFTNYEEIYNKDYEFLNHSWEVYSQEKDVVKLQRTDNRSILLHIKT